MEVVVGAQVTLHSGFSFMLPSLVAKDFLIGLFSLPEATRVRLNYVESSEAVNHEIAFL